MNYRFTLNGIEIEEPLGFRDINLRIQRDDIYHGVFFEASTSTLGFYGAAFDIIKDALDSDGVDAQVVFLAEIQCEGSEDYSDVLRGSLNFRSYDESCGDECIIRMNVEQDSCAKVLKNRFDQKVDMDSNIAFDGTTIIPSYAALGMEMELPPQVIPVAVEGFVLDTDYFERMNFVAVGTPPQVAIRPTYENIIDNSIRTGNLNTALNSFIKGISVADFPLTPQLLMEDTIQCFNGEFDYYIRMKGSITVSGSDGTADIYARLVAWNGEGDFFTNMTVIDSATIATNVSISIGDPPTTIPFDEILSGTVAIPEGMGIYAIIHEDIDAGSGIFSVSGFFDRLTTFNVSAAKNCPPTQTEAYLIHESLAHVAEAITDGCITVRSEYYGRTDSLPYSAAQDGCGSLRMLTSGLKIRQADHKKFFVSMKEVIDNLRAIDNIGMAVDGNILRVERAEWFYQDTEIARFDAIPSVSRRMDESRVYSRILGGYDKWQIESVKGIDEFNSKREYRTQVKAVETTLDIQSKFIAAGYIIEDIRTLALLDTGSTDHRYDNETFIIQLRRSSYGLEVEQGGIASPAGMFSPQTAYNWRLRPIYNLIRWWRSIGRTEIRFSYGEGNYEASGFISDSCSVETATIAENATVTSGKVKGNTDPIWEPFSLTFDYPLSIAEYNDIKANPYGYISLQCGNGEYIKAYIRSIEYKINLGQATFNLIPAWPSA